MKASKLAVIVALLFVAVLVFWWFGLNEYRDMVHTVHRLESEMGAMREHVQETERVLAAVRSLELQVREARSEADEELANTMRYSGNDRIDRLERLLEADLANRHSPSCPVTGGLPGAGGEGGSPDAVKGK